MKIRAIRPSFFSVIRKDGYFDIQPLKTEYTGEMNGNILSFHIHHVYKNSQGSPSDKAVLTIPKSHSQCISGIDCTLDGQKIEIKLEEKKKAQEIRKEGMMNGKTTIISTTNPQSDVIYINIGLLGSESECDITIHMEIVSSNVDYNTYQTLIPLPEIHSKKIDFNLSIQYNEYIKISSIEIQNTQKINVKHIFNNNILSIEKNPSGPIFIYTKLVDEIPNIIQNDLNGEFSTVSVIPQLTSDTSNSDYIFLVDCSGSMRGSPIKNASECLLVFLHSLPIGCKFNIVKFGTLFESIFDKDCLVDYNEANLKEAEKAALELKANMHETNLLEPLLYSYDLSEKVGEKGRIVQIFILTDGRINNNRKVFDLVQQNRSKNRIFSVGIGAKVDTELICGLSNLTFGNFDFVDKMSEMTEKVVGLLSSSLNPALTNVSVHALDENGEDLESLEIVPNPIPFLVNGRLMNFFIKSDKAIKTVLISGDVESEQVEILIDNELKCGGLAAKRLFAFYAIKDYERICGRLDKSQVDKITEIRQQIIKLSIENGILSEFTSFVGVEEGPGRKRNVPKNEMSEQEVQMFSGRRGRMVKSGLRGQKTKKKYVNKCSSKAKSSPRHDSDDFDDDEEGNEIFRGKSKFAQHKFSSKGKSMYNHDSDDDEENVKVYQRSKCFQKKKFEVSDDDDDENKKIYKRSKCFQKKKFEVSDDDDDENEKMYQRPKCSQKKKFVVSDDDDDENEKMYQRPKCSQKKKFVISDDDNSSDDECLAKNMCGKAQHINQKAKVNSISLTEIITMQDFDGKWNPSLFGKLVDCINKYKKDFDSIIVFNRFFSSLDFQESESADGIKTTVIAICVLNIVFHEENSKWRLIENKAINWLNSKLKKNWPSEISQLLTLI